MAVSQARASVGRNGSAVSRGIQLNPVPSPLCGRGAGGEGLSAHGQTTPTFRPGADGDVVLLSLAHGNETMGTDGTRGTKFFNLTNQAVSSRRKVGGGSPQPAAGGPMK